MTQLRTNLVAYINNLLIKTHEFFYLKCLLRTSIGHPRVKTEPDKFQIPEPKNHGGKFKPEPEPARPKTR
jgi:hypothetical protein